MAAGRSSDACCARSPADDAVRFFQTLGVPLHEEADGKLFPDTNRSRDVLTALLRGVDAAGVQLLADHRVLDVCGRRF